MAKRIPGQEIIREVVLVESFDPEAGGLTTWSRSLCLTLRLQANTIVPHYISKSNARKLRDALTEILGDVK